jgi:hypothetical protein
MAQERKPKRRWWQFSVRRALLLMLLVAAVLAWLVVPVHHARQQYAAIKALRELGWEVKCDPSTSSPAWVRKAFGEELKQLHLYGTGVTDEGVARLQQALPDCTIWH